MPGLGGDLPDRIGNYLVSKTYAPGDDPWVVRHAWLGDVLSRHASKDIAIKEAKRLQAVDNRRSRRRLLRFSTLRAFQSAHDFSVGFAGDGCSNDLCLVPAA